MGKHTERSNDRAYIDSKIKELENVVKERETSILRAIKTLVQDFSEYHEGKRDEFPRAALYGAIFAYLRPRIVLVLGSIAAVVVGTLQLWLLFNQKTLIEQQNSYIHSQSESNRLQAVTAVLANLDNKDPDAIEIAVAQLSTFGDEGFEVLLRLTHSGSDEIAEAAQIGLSRSANSHSQSQSSKTTDLLLEKFIAVSIVLNSYISLEQENFGNGAQSTEIFDVAYDWIASGERLNEYLDQHAHKPGGLQIPEISGAVLRRLIRVVYSQSDERNNSIALARKKLNPRDAQATGTFAAFESQQAVVIETLSTHVELWCERIGGGGDCSAFGLTN